MAAFIRHTLRGEWYGIFVDPVRHLRRRGLPGLSLAFVAAFGVIFFHDLAQRPTGARAVWLLGGVTADLPLWLALLRTPVSLYVPALDLPVWAGIAQLFLAFALAELTLGRTRTLAVSYVTTLAGTLTVRVMIAVGPGRWGFGLPPEIGRVLDTGPSAAVVGLFTYIAVIRRAPIVFVLTGGSMVWESIAKPNLAGREHLIAVVASILLGLSHGRGRGRSAAWALQSSFVRERRRHRGLRPPGDARPPSPRVVPPVRLPAHRSPSGPARDAAGRPEGVPERKAPNQITAMATEAGLRGPGTTPAGEARSLPRPESATAPRPPRDRGRMTDATANGLTTPRPPSGL
ncbi:hypothetical protein [Streptomyces sp. NPDC051569]|uniref:hypothetical protein n=1 Tax=Streptomyces sp. NPDC051569 TaxID=3365661 RepID=UPI0037B22C19